MVAATNRKRKLVTMSFGGILIASTLLFFIAADYYLDVQKATWNVAVEVTDITITVTGWEVVSISLTCMIINPSESIKIQVRHVRVEILSLNGNTTKYLVKYIYPQVGEKIAIIPEEVHPITVRFEEIYKTDQPILQWALVHEEWHWEIYIRALEDVGYSQIIVSKLYRFEGVEVTQGATNCTGIEGVPSQRGSLRKHGGVET